MIYDKITQMAKKSSPEGSSSAARGIEIDEANHQVWVEGRQVALSPTEFDVLLYLYNHPGQLCTRRSIVEEGFKGKYIGNHQEASRINTTMGRLRKKIEPDPDHPRYILTVRGEGYMLCLGGDEDRS
jgi:DNA-binding response OmpR family regulator